jgi:tRNA(Ile)-lysidine synthase
LRGSGLAGLSGIPPVRSASAAVTLVRPLLSVTRAQILDFLHSQGHTYQVDEQYTQRRFMRCRIRHELLPLLERDYYGGVRQSLLRLARVAADAQQVIHELAEDLVSRCLLPAELTCGPLGNAPEHLRREAFVILWQQQGWPMQDMSLDHWQRLADLAAVGADENRLELPGSIEIRRARDRLCLSRRSR